MGALIATSDVAHHERSNSGPARLLVSYVYLLDEQAKRHLRLNWNHGEPVDERLESVSP